MLAVCFSSIYYSQLDLQYLNADFQTVIDDLLFLFSLHCIILIIHQIYLSIKLILDTLKEKKRQTLH